MILSVHQPNFWPYPGLLGKIMRSDRFVYLTKVQFEKSSWQSRNRIRTQEGWTYIRVPTLTKGKLDQKICDVEIDSKREWKQKQFRTLQFAYGKAPYYAQYEPFLEDFYSREWTKLMDVDIYIMNYLLQELDIKTEIFYDTDYQFEGAKTDLLVDMCKQLQCDTYMSNLGSQAYVEIERFTNAQCNHRYIDYQGCTYEQQYPGFEPGLSILDMLMNCGAERTKEILRTDEYYRFSKLNEKLL